MRLKFKKRLILIIGILILSLLRIYITYNRPVSAIGYNINDDQLYISLASHLVKGEWFGLYNYLTLSKNSFYPIFIAVNYFTGLPLLLTQDLLYIFSGIAIIFIMNKFIKKNWFLLFLYSIFIFNPMTFSDFSGRVLREGISPALCILVLMGFIYLNLIIKLYSKKNLVVAFIVGLFLSAFWLTKEDSVWILPSLFFLNLLCILRYFFVFKKNKRYFIFGIILIPYIVLFFLNNLIAGVNYLKYKNFVTSELKSRSFVSAYGALSRVKPNQFESYIPVTKSMREEIYKVVPEFYELSFAEESIYPGWSLFNPYCTLDKKYCGEIAGGWYTWALRDVVATKGYYSNAEIANNFYNNLANKINMACDSGKLQCYKKRVTLQPIYKKSQIKPLLYTIFSSIKFVYHFDGFSSIYLPSGDSGNNVSLFQNITRNEVVPISGYNNIQNGQIGFKICSVLGKLYQKYFRYIYYLSIFAFILNIISSLKKNILNNNLFLISLTLFITIISRVTLISLVDLTTFNAVNSIYLSPVYPLLIVFSLINIYWLLSKFKFFIQKQRQ